MANHDDRPCPCIIPGCTEPAEWAGQFCQEHWEKFCSEAWWDEISQAQRMTDALMSANYPVPDPAWDYAGVWPRIWRLEQQARTLRELLQGTEEANAEADRQVKDLLTGIRTEAERLLKTMEG